MNNDNKDPFGVTLLLHVVEDDTQTEFTDWKGFQAATAVNISKNGVELGYEDYPGALADLVMEHFDRPGLGWFVFEEVDPCEYEEDVGLPYTPTYYRHKQPRPATPEEIALA